MRSVVEGSTNAEVTVSFRVKVEIERRKRFDGVKGGRLTVEIGLRMRDDSGRCHEWRVRYGDSVTAAWLSLKLRSLFLCVSSFVIYM